MNPRVAQVASLAVFCGAAVLLLGGCQQEPQGPTPMDLQRDLRLLQQENTQLQSRLTALETKVTELSRKKDGTTFTDIADIPNKKLIEDLGKLDIFQSMGPKFEPFKPISRGTFVSWMFKIHNTLNPAQAIQLAPGITPRFKDVPDTHPSFPYVQALANAGYDIGYNAETFKPDAPITREEMLAMKINLDLGKTVPANAEAVKSLWKFNDAAKITPRYTGYIAEDAKLTGPHGGNIIRTFGKTITLNPKEPAQRYEAAKLLWQFGPSGKINAGVGPASVQASR